MSVYLRNTNILEYVFSFYSRNQEKEQAKYLLKHLKYEQFPVQNFLKKDFEYLPWNELEFGYILSLLRIRKRKATYILNP